MAKHARYSYARLALWAFLAFLVFAAVVNVWGKK